MITIEMQPHGGVPRWVGESLGRTPFVVVRRGTITADAIPIGIRGEVDLDMWFGMLTYGVG